MGGDGGGPGGGGRREDAAGQDVEPRRPGGALLARFHSHLPHPRVVLVVAAQVEIESNA